MLDPGVLVRYLDERGKWRKALMDRPQTSKQAVGRKRAGKRARAAAGEPRSVFDLPLGVAERCFSARKLVQAVRHGVSGADQEHLLACGVCREYVSRLAAVRLGPNPEFINQALQKGAGAESAEVLYFGAMEPPQPPPSEAGFQPLTNDEPHSPLGRPD